MLTIEAFLAHNYYASFLNLWPKFSAKCIVCANSSFQPQELNIRTLLLSPSFESTGDLASSLDFSALWIHSKLWCEHKGLSVSFSVRAASAALTTTSLSLKGGVTDLTATRRWPIPFLSVSASGSSVVFHLILLPSPFSHLLKQRPSFSS